MIAYFDPNGLSTVKDNVLIWARSSRFNFDLINLYHGTHQSGLELPSSIDLKKYDGIVVHCTVAYNVYNLRALDRRLKTKFSDYNGLKVIMKQDEHYKPRSVSEFIHDNGFQMVLSVAPKETLDVLYPLQRDSNVRFVPMLTGYLSKEMRSWSSNTKRDLDIVYRGSLQPFTFGRLGYDKRWIGDEFEKICKTRGLKYDISSRWEDRILGENWYKFLASSKGTVGVESGASIVDFTGEVEVQNKLFLQSHPEASFLEAEAAFLHEFEGNVQYRAIAPRHFEAIVCKTAQILVRGSYSGILEADRHYFALEPNLSNVNEVMERFLDNKERSRIVETAFDEIAMNDAFQYKGFVDRVDQEIEEVFGSRI